MELTELAKMKVPYRSKIHVYVARKEQIKQMYGIGSSKFKRSSRTINKKLSVWRRAIKRIEYWEHKIKMIDIVIIDFVGVSAKNSGNNKFGEKWLAKHFMCRYGKDSGVPAIFIRAYIGLHAVNVVGAARLRLIRKCAKDDNLMNTWKNFKSEIEHESAA